MPRRHVVLLTDDDLNGIARLDNPLAACTGTADLLTATMPTTTGTVYTLNEAGLWQIYATDLPIANPTPFVLGWQQNPIVGQWRDYWVKKIGQHWLIDRPSLSPYAQFDFIEADYGNVFNPSIQFVQSAGSIGGVATLASGTAIKITCPVNNAPFEVSWQASQFFLFGTNVDSIFAVFVPAIGGLPTLGADTLSAEGRDADAKGPVFLQTHPSASNGIHCRQFSGSRVTYLSQNDEIYAASNVTGNSGATRPAVHKVFGRIVIRPLF
jgi:hypothetical protein